VLADALRRTVDDNAMAARARSLGQLISAENGVTAVVAHFPDP
jgi:hypothetical protein